MQGFPDTICHYLYIHKLEIGSYLALEHIMMTGSLETLLSSPQARDTDKFHWQKIKCMEIAYSDAYPVVHFHQTIGGVSLEWDHTGQNYANC